MYTLCNENDDCYAHLVNWRPSEGIFLRLAPDVAGTVCICRACGEEYKRGFHSSEYMPRKPHTQAFPASYQTLEVKKAWE